MKEEIDITFEEFGWHALEERAAQERVELEELVGLAISHYESELSSGRPAIDVPRFRRAPAQGEIRTLELEIDEGCKRRLQQEAERRGVALERVCEHAVLFFLADLDAGRVAERVIRRAGSDADPPQSPHGSSA